MSEFRVNSITNQDGSAGPQVCGVSTFSGKSGVQIPSGPTDFRRQDGGGRGRGVFVAGGYGPTPTVNTMNFVEIATTGSATDFGDISSNATETRGSASPTRFAFSLGATPSNTNQIEYVQIMTTGNTVDFGDLTAGNQYGAGASNGHGGL